MTQIGDALDEVAGANGPEHSSPWRKARLIQMALTPIGWAQIPTSSRRLPEGDANVEEVSKEDGESISFRRLPETDIDQRVGEQLQALLQSSFAEYPDRSYFKLPPHFRYLAEINGDLAAQMGVELRIIRNGVHVMRVFGIVDLCVMPTSRSLGVATTLLKGVTQFARECDVEFIVLFADDDRLYLKNGWTRVDNPCSWVKIDNHTTLGIAGNVKTHAMMVKAMSDRPWPEGEVDLLGHLF